MHTTSGLERLPAELICEIQLFALNETLPVVNKWTQGIFSSTLSYYRAQYILQRFLCPLGPQRHRKGVVTFALQFPICTEDVLGVVLRISSSFSRFVRPELPRRLFKPLKPRAISERWSAADAPLPFLRYLYAKTHDYTPDPNAHEGYALSRAVHAGFRPLVKFLLHHGATPKLKNALAVRIAIKKRDFALVRALIEREVDDVSADEHLNDGNVGKAGGDGGVGVGAGTIVKKKSTKRRRLTDRLEVTTAMLRTAVEVDARDIVEYFRGKGARPDILTLQHLAAVSPPAWVKYFHEILNHPDDFCNDTDDSLENDCASEEHCHPIPFGFVQSRLLLGKAGHECFSMSKQSLWK